MALTNIQVRSAKPKEKPYKLADEKRLHLFVTINGSKYWRFKYRFGGTSVTNDFFENLQKFSILRILKIKK